MTGTPMIVASCHGVHVPDSPMITPERAERIDAARYEGQEIAGALKVVRPGDTVLELGAGIGLVGAIVAGNCAPARVVSFEANPNLIPHIETLYALNGLSKLIEVRNQVLVSAPEAPSTMTFHIRNSYLGSSLIDSDKRQTTQVDVPTAAYADLQAEIKPDVLLMDIEGGELEFLRHASLDGIRAVVIEFHPEAYGKKGMRTCKAILEKAGFARIPELSTRHVWTCTQDAAASPPLPDGGWSEKLSEVENAIVVPPKEARQSFVQPAGVLHADGAYCPSGALWRNGRALTITPSLPDDKIAEREGTWLWGGVLWMHFGHFLVESTARLWALEARERDVDGILFIPKRPRNGSEVAGFQKEFLALLGCDLPLVCLDQPTRVERLIVPGQGFGLGKMITGTEAFRTTIAERFAADVTPDGPERLYISRSALPAGRGHLLGEGVLERHLADQGYTIYHPQNHDLRHQVATYKAARQIIAAEGSALHLLAMVARPDQQVAIIVRRPSGATRNLERHLQAFSGLTPLTLTRLKRSWKPVGAAKSRMWKGELDLPALHLDLAAAGLLGSDAVPWTALDPEEVEATLGDGFEEVA